MQAQAVQSGQGEHVRVADDGQREAGRVAGTGSRTAPEAARTRSQHRVLPVAGEAVRGCAAPERVREYIFNQGVQSPHLVLINVLIGIDWAPCYSHFYKHHHI